MGLLQPFLAVALLVIKMKRSNSRTEWKNPGENRKLSTFPRYTRELRRLRKSWPLRTRARSLYLKPNIGDVVQPRYRTLFFLLVCAEYQVHQVPMYGGEQGACLHCVRTDYIFAPPLHPNWSRGKKIKRHWSSIQQSQ